MVEWGHGCDLMARKDPMMICVDPYVIENVNRFFMAGLIKLVWCHLLQLEG